MAVTTESSVVTNFPLRTFNTGPGFVRDAPARDQQPTKKSATERLTESRSRYFRRGSREELEDEEGEENRSHCGTHRVRQVSVTAHEATQADVFRAVPCVQDGGGRSAAPKSKARLPPPVPEKPAQSVRTRTGSRDRMLEIVEASVGHGAPRSSDLPNSSSPRVGSRVRKLKEQFLNLGSAESGTDSSQGRASPTELLKSSSSSDSPHVLRKRSVPSTLQDTQASEIQAPSEASTVQTELHLCTSHTLSGKPKLLERSNVEATDLSEVHGTATEEYRGLSQESGTKSKPQQAPAISTESLSDQTRRQMERFRARYATDSAKESSQDRRINKIILKPTSLEADGKARSSSVNEPSRQLASGVVRPGKETSKEGRPGQSSQVSSKPDPFSRPHAPGSKQPVPDGDEQSNEESKQNGMSQNLNFISHHGGSIEIGWVDPDICKPMTSDDIRRLRRSRENNISGKSPEHLGDAEECRKSQGSLVEHAVHHAGDRVLVKVSGSVFPSKYHVSDKAFQTVMQPQDTCKDSSTEIIHRRAKSDLVSPAEESNSNRMRHRSQDDLHVLHRDPLLSVSKRKTSAESVLIKPTKSSPDSIKDFKKKSWAPVNFSRIQNMDGAHRRGTQEGINQNRRAVSPDLSRTQTAAPLLQNPQTHVHVPQQHSGRGVSQEGSHKQAKLTVQSFLSGIMNSPGGGELQVSPRTLHSDGNGNLVTLEFSDVETDTPGTHWARPAKCTDGLNSNVSFANPNNQTGAPSSKDVELTAVCEKRQPRVTPLGKETSGQMEHRRKYLGPSKEGGRTEELDKRRKFNHNADTSLSSQDRVRLVAGCSSVEPQSAKKVSLADLLSKDATQENTTAAKPNQEGNTKCVAQPRPDARHGDDSETDSDVEYRRTKILRLKKPPRHANQKKEDKSLENLLSRIINPDDELNTLKRGTKLKVREKPKAKVSRTSSRNTYGSSTAESDNEAGKEKDLPTRKNLPYRDTTSFQPGAPVSKPHQRQGTRPVNRKDAVPPREALPSPTGRDFPRPRSKSDLGMSPRCSVSSVHSEVERFFNQMGLNESFFQGPLSPMACDDEDEEEEEEVFHEMHEYKHVRDEDDGTFSTENSDNISRGSKVSEEGLHRAKKLPDTSQSIITKNARVIKWLCQMRKARAASFS